MAAPEAVAVAGPHVRRLASSDSVPVGGFTPGAILADRYRIIGLLGRGGMGEVYRARDTRLGRDVALKVLPDHLLDSDRLARFDREAQVVASLSHPNIAATHGLEHLDGRPVLVLELVEGPTLADRIAQGPVPQQEAVPEARQAQSRGGVVNTTD